MTTATETTTPLPPGLARWLAERRLTPRERDVVATFYHLQAKGDGVVGPTQADIADALSVTRSSVCTHIDRLVTKGVFDRVPYRTAGLRLLWEEMQGPPLVAMEAVGVMLGVAEQIRKSFPGFANKLKEAAAKLESAVGAEGNGEA